MKNYKEEIVLLESEKIGREKLYKNIRLIKIIIKKMNYQKY